MQFIIKIFVVLDFMLQKDGPEPESRPKPVRGFYLPRTYMRKRSTDTLQ